MVGIDPESEGLALARKHGVEADQRGRRLAARTATTGPTSCSRRRRRTPTSRTRPAIAEAGIRAVDLTPAARRSVRDPGRQPHRAPRRDERQHGDLWRPGDDPDGATPSSRIVEVPYAEIVATVASRSAGPGTRANIDEFTRTTSSAVEVLGGAAAGQGDHHPQPGRAAADHARHDLLSDPRRRRSRRDRGVDRRCRRQVQQYVPGYRLRQRPQFDPAERRPARPGWRSSSRSRGPATTSRPTPATSTS